MNTAFLLLPAIYFTLKQSISVITAFFESYLFVEWWTSMYKAKSDVDMQEKHRLIMFKSHAFPSFFFVFPSVYKCHVKKDKTYI